MQKIYVDIEKSNLLIAKIDLVAFTFPITTEIRNIDRYIVNCLII